MWAKAFAEEGEIGDELSVEFAAGRFIADSEPRITAVSVRKIE